MTDTKHSPLPWGVNEELNIHDANGDLLYARYCEWDSVEDAALIVEAVNSHARLKAEREELVRELSRCASLLGARDGTTAAERKEQTARIDALLSRLGGGA